jgi:hypothetical protein
MSNDMRDWVAFAMTAVTVFLDFRSLWAGTRRRRRRSERFRSLKAWGLEWTAYDREDDSQS